MKDEPLRPQREPWSHFWIWLIYIGLYAVSIPWYLPRTEPMPVWLGFPYWVVISLGAMLGIALFTLFVIGRYWSDHEREDR